MTSPFPRRGSRRAVRPSPHIAHSAARRLFAGAALLAAAACAGNPAGPAEPEVAQVVLSPSAARGPAAVAVSPSNASVEAGATVQLVALDASGNPVRASWSSSAPGVAAVNGGGLVTGVAAGSAVITARTRKQSASATVTVTAPAAPPPVAPPPVAPASCADAPHARLVSVASAAQLSEALAGARPGDLIRLADGVYAGRFVAGASGTAEQPIRLCGTRDAVLDGGGVSGGTGFTLKGSWWVVEGIRVTNVLSGIILQYASHNVLRGVEVHRIGQTAVHFGWNSSRNTLENSRIYDTGRHVAEYGEGVYLGSYNGHWCARTGCQPDRSDYNQVLGNVIGPDVRAEAVDVKEGTTGGVIRGNTFHGAGMVQSQPWVDSWVELKGNGYLVADNRGDQSLRDGYQVFRQIDGWGNDNTFRNNTSDVRAPGYGFSVGSGTTGNAVDCANTVQNAGSGFANVRCS